METAALKSFATWARVALIGEVGARVAAVLAPGSSARVEQAQAIAALEKAVDAAGGGDTGRAAVVDKVAYIWFNRIIALRFMDANGYTGVGVVSPPVGVEVGQPEILAAAKRAVIDTEVVRQTTRVAVAGLLDGTRPSNDPQGEAYALLLADYCRYWNRAMPFMFEREGDFTELLIPANLLADGSVLNRAVLVLTEDVCKDVEVIGWLYQFYISERKDEVFAGFKKNKKAGADEIPAATQLFTPHWIVRYLVENSLGRLWMLNRPSSGLVNQMDYYITPVDEETDFLKIAKPEELKVIDPACGSGHMLTYAFDLLHAIYEEEGYSPAEIPGLILMHNLYGTEIDQRAGALAAFALTMKARGKQRTFFKNLAEPNVCVIESISFDHDEIEFLLTPGGDRQEEVALWNQFEHADLLGSLVEPSPYTAAKLASRASNLEGTDLLASDVIRRADRVVEQAQYLSTGYSVVIANPPYMGSGNFAPTLRRRLEGKYKVTRSDLYAIFAERCLPLALPGGYIALVTMQAWMFTTSYESLRELILSRTSISTLAQFGTRAFESISGEIVATAAFVLRNSPPRPKSRGSYMRLVEGDAVAKEVALRTRTGILAVEQQLMSDLPASPLVYWEADFLHRLYSSYPPIGDVAPIREGIHTGDNARFLRYWWEVSEFRLKLDTQRREDIDAAGARWVPYNKGGTATRWYGNNSIVIAFDSEARAAMSDLSGFVEPSKDLYFREGGTWSDVGTSGLKVKYYPVGYLFDAKGPVVVGGDQTRFLIGAMNSSTFGYVSELLMPTISYKVGTVKKIPLPSTAVRDRVAALVSEAVEIARRDWDSDELSWDFGSAPVLEGASGDQELRVAFEEWARQASGRDKRLREIEELNNRLFTEWYALANDGLNRQLAFYPSDVSAPTTKACAEKLISYAVGCMFGRYSLEKQGLILGDQGATLQDYLAKVPSPSFTPDADNVIPIVDGDWFEDDIVARFRQFLRVAFGEEYFEENLRFVTESLGVKSLRDYFAKSFYKDHVQRYKKRPIYWLFSSPKGSFNALIYMHRYTPSTVSVVLNEYLREFQGKLRAALEHAERSNDAKEADRIRKVLVELEEYEHDILYPLASQNIVIDLDDGVKANYPKFDGALKKIPGLEATE
jgi:hypothetical protein